MEFIPVEVDCMFDLNGDVRLRRVRINQQWQHVDQGRQWQDEHGRHLLVMTLDGHLRELILRPSLRWEIGQRAPGSRRAML